MGRLSTNKNSLLYGIALAFFLFLLKWLELKFIVLNYSFEIYTSAIAIVFTGLGIWLALKLVKPKKETVIIEKTIFIEKEEFVIDQKQLEKSELNKHELEVLELITKNLSNQ